MTVRCLFTYHVVNIKLISDGIAYDVILLFTYHVVNIKLEA